MSKCFVLITLLIMVLSGCASKRFFVKKESNSLMFYLQKSGANRVQFATSSDHYILHDTRKNSSGLWQIEVPINDEFKYFYMVDGLIYIPECRFKEKDDFGTENCLYLF